MRWIGVMIGLALASVVSADDGIEAKIKALQQIRPTIQPAPVPSPPKEVTTKQKTTYQRAKERAEANNGILICWVGTDEDCRSLSLYTNYGDPVSTWVKSLSGQKAGIVLAHPNGKTATLAEGSTNAQIQEAVARLEGTADAIPFDNSLQAPRYDSRRLGVQPDADASATGPWLPRGEQDAVKAMWPKGVPWDERNPPRFYHIPRASQAVASLNDVNPYNVNPVGGNNRPFMFSFVGRENANREFPWIGSGGMDWATPGTWRNVTGMAIPTGKRIRVWTSPMRVSTQYEVGLHWDFPVGTQMFDVLIRKPSSGNEHIFNVRRRTKTEHGWDNGTSFMPDINGNGWSQDTETAGTRADTVLGVSRIKYRSSTVAIKGKVVRFKEVADSRKGMDDGGHFFPPGFRGTGISCSKCHSPSVQETQTYGGPLLRGKDTVFSWYPVNPSQISASENSAANLVPQLDYRWPIEFIGNYQARYGE